MQNPTRVDEAPHGYAPEGGAPPATSVHGDIPPADIPPATSPPATSPPAAIPPAASPPAALSPPAVTLVPGSRRGSASGLGHRFEVLRGGQLRLDGETRLRRLLTGLLLVQVVLWIVLALSRAYAGLVVAIVGAGVLAAAIVLFGPTETDAAVPEAAPTLDPVLAAQREEIAGLRRAVATAEASSDLQSELARRQAALLQRQLAAIDDLEARETDPVALGELFGLDHLATRMRRCAEGVLVLRREPGAPSAGGAPAVPLSEALRGAVAEVEEFSRVDVTLDHDVPLDGVAVADVVHLLAELVENATVFSSPATRVAVHGAAGVDGYAVTVTDYGVGLDVDRAAEVAALLAAEHPPLRPGTLGYQVVARLAARHAIAIVLAPAPGGGTTVTVTLPPALVGDPAALTALAPIATLPGPDPVGYAQVPADPEPFLAAYAEQAADPVPSAYAPPVQLAPETFEAPPAYSPVEAQPYGFLPVDTLPADVSADASADLPQAAPPVTEEPFEIAWQAVAAAPAPVSAPPAWPTVEPAAFVPAALLVPAAPPVADLGASPNAMPVNEPVAEPAAEPLAEQVAQPAVEPVGMRTAEPVAEPVESAPAPVESAVTPAGLQRRVPMSNMSAKMPATEEPELLADEGRGPVPERSRWLLSAYRDGLVLGRGGLTVPETGPGTVPDQSDQSDRTEALDPHEGPPR